MSFYYANFAVLPRSLWHPYPTHCKLSNGLFGRVNVTSRPEPLTDLRARVT